MFIPPRQKAQYCKYAIYSWTFFSTLLVAKVRGESILYCNISLGLHRAQEDRLPSPPSFKCNVLRESLSEESQNIHCATPQSTYVFSQRWNRVSASAHSAGAYTAALLVMVNVMRGGGRAPPTLTSQGKFYPHDWMYARKQRLLLCDSVRNTKEKGGRG